MMVLQVRDLVKEFEGATGWPPAIWRWTGER